MLHCEYCETAKPSARTRWFEAHDSAEWIRPIFWSADICDECNAARKVPMVNQKPSLGGPLTEEERAIIREWGELPEYWWRRP